MELHTYKLDEIKAEIRRELKMRRQVWPRVSGMAESFISMEHQRRYDILKQISEVLDYGKPEHYNILRESAETQVKREALKAMEAANTLPF